MLRDSESSVSVPKVLRRDLGRNLDRLLIGSVLPIRQVWDRSRQQL